MKRSSLVSSMSILVLAGSALLSGCATTVPAAGLAEGAAVPAAAAPVAPAPAAPSAAAAAPAASKAAAVSNGCDTAQAVGSCAVTVQRQGSRLVVCPDAQSIAASSPSCMNATVDVKYPGRKSHPANVMLKPGQCQPLSTKITAATPISCEAFGPAMTAAQ